MYQAADYLRRLDANSFRPPVPGAQRPATPLTALARLVATVLPILDPTGQVFAAFVKELHWTDQQADRLQALAKTEGPIHLRGTIAASLRKAAA